MKVAFAIAAVAVLAARPAHADQCEWLDDASIARRAARELASHPELVEFCEPCGDAAPGAPRRATRVEVRAIDDHSEVVIDGETIDLAYVYLRTSAQQYRNLALLSGCATTGVSASLRVDRATETSVLIHADAAPMATRTPAIVFVESRSDFGRRLATLALLGTLAALAIWRIARRRLRHVPRATNL